MTPACKVVVVIGTVAATRAWAKWRVLVAFMIMVPATHSLLISIPCLSGSLGAGILPCFLSPEAFTEGP